MKKSAPFWRPSPFCSARACPDRQLRRPQTAERRPAPRRPAFGGLHPGGGFRLSSAGRRPAHRQSGGVGFAGEHGLVRQSPELEGLELSQEMLRQLQSQLIITFVDAALNEMTVNSQEGCVQADTFEVRQIANGVRIVYDFAEAVTSFRIPVEITLADDYVQASIVYPEIEEYGTSRLTSVSLLPYFGAGESGEDGYALVPDGSGALIRFSDSGRGASPTTSRYTAAIPPSTCCSKAWTTPKASACRCSVCKRRGTPSWPSSMPAPPPLPSGPSPTAACLLYGGEQRLYLSSAGLDRHPG